MWSWDHRIPYLQLLPQSSLLSLLLNFISNSNLFKMKFSTCVSYSIRLSWNTVYEFFKLYSPLEITNVFVFFFNRACILIHMHSL